SRRRHTRFSRDWSSDVCSSDLAIAQPPIERHTVRVDALNDLVATVGDQFWTWVVLPILVVLGVYFTVRSGVVQFRLIPEMFRTRSEERRVGKESRLRWARREMI